MKRLEAICDSIAMYNRYTEPESEAYEMRNPGLLPGESGKRIFSCHRAGYAALLDRVQKHCQQHQDAKIESLLDTFGIKMRIQQENAIDFMARCLSNNALKFGTPLQWFLE